MENDLYAAGHATGYAQGQIDGNILTRAEMKARYHDILSEVSDFLDNYTDAEYIDGRPVGNRAMNLKASIDELL